MDEDFLNILACPYDRQSLIRSGEYRLACSQGHSFPLISGVPVLLRSDVADTLWVASASLKTANESLLGNFSDPNFIQTLGLTERQRDDLFAQTSKSGAEDFLRVISFMIGATSGFLYKDLVGEEFVVPIPSSRVPTGEGLLLDIGCNWGRWSIAAARQGYRTIGIDPSLGALLAAQKLAKRDGLPCCFVCADARYLPFTSGAFDQTFSYSVFQHFSKENANAALTECYRVLGPGGIATIQMPNAFGLRSLWHILRRSRKPQEFDVRYWTPSEISQTFAKRIGLSRLEVDGFLGLGIQVSDLPVLPVAAKLVVITSEILRAISKALPFLKYFADSLYCIAEKPRSGSSSPK